ncbi:MAG: hypothetical protein IPM06_17485 [Rhizobiales bacterium]|nr:hypothetical protein [Hyphomicrobiales bacterium]
MAFDRLINAMDLRGLSGTEIAAQLLQTHGITMSPQAVRSRIRKMNAATHQAREDKIAHEERLLTWAISEAMDAWESSKRVQETTITERRDSGEGGASLKASVRKETTSGEATHLGNLIRASERRSKLLGLDAPAKQELSGPDAGRIPIDLFQQALLRAYDDPDTNDATPAS